MQPRKSRVAVLDNMTDIDNYARLSVFFFAFFTPFLLLFL